MWDVIWTDPDKELVREHRAKKCRLKDDKEQSSIRSGRNSAATSSSNSSSETPFSFFRARSAKKAIALKEKEANRSPSFSGLATPSLTSTLSPFSQTFDSSSRRSSGMITTAPTSPNKDGSEALFSGSDRDTFPSFDECLSQSFGSIDSASVHPTNSFKDGTGDEPPNLAALIQMLGDLPPRLDLQDIPRSTSSDTGIFSMFKGRSEEKSSISTPLATAPKSPTPGRVFPSADLPESPVVLTPPPKSPRRPTPTLLGINNPATWRTPSQWRNHDAKKAKKFAQITFKSSEEESDVKTETFAASDTILGVESAAGAPTAMILAKVKQVWNGNHDESKITGPESSKQHWMLSLLHGLGYITYTDLEGARVMALPAGASIMLLYESQAYATYLSTFHTGTQVYHLTKESANAAWLHNIQPVQAPPAEATCFPIAARSTQVVYSFSLPSNCSYNFLPNILSSVYKCLKPGGTFRVTIIDPLPCAETLGQKLRAWMEKHLFPNIEKDSRCLEPSRLFPKLLGDAELRGKGSRRTKVKFFALQENARGGEYHDPDPSIKKLYRERQDKAELRSLIGRMFWMEVWGQHVTPPNTWWWNDPECVAECRQLGTFWEYHIIDAVKGAECV